VTASCCTDDDVGALEQQLFRAEACGLACDVTPCRSEARLEAVLVFPIQPVYFCYCYFLKLSRLLVVASLVLLQRIVILLTFPLLVADVDVRPRFTAVVPSVTAFCCDAGVVTPFEITVVSSGK